MTVSFLKPRSVEREANRQAVQILEGLLGEAREGQIVGLAWAVDYGHEMRCGFTSTDDNMSMAGIVARLQHQVQLAIDAEHGEPV